MGVVDIPLKLSALKIKNFVRFGNSTGKWRELMEFWITQASGNYRLGWLICNNPNAIHANTPAFYRNLMNTFKQVGGKVNYVVSCCNEARDITLWEKYSHN